MKLCTDYDRPSITRYRITLANVHCACAVPFLASGWVDKRHMIVLETGVHNWINMNFQAQMIAKTNYYHLARYYRLQNEAV